MMASEISKPRVFGNFKDRGAKAPHRNSERHKDRPGMDPAHLALVRLLPCCVCRLKPPVDPHHLKSGTGERGMGLRSTDKWAVPLCRAHHDDVERVGAKNEREWFLQFGIDPHTLARGLWASSGDIKKMATVIVAHQPTHRRTR